MGLSFSDLMGQLSTSAAINNSKFGDTGNKLLDFARPAVDFLTGAYGAYQSGRDGGTAVAGLGNVVEGMSRRNYMDLLSDQQRANRDLQFKKNEQTIQGINSSLDPNNQQLGFGDLADPSVALKLAQDRLGQTGKATNFLYRNQSLDAIQGGQNQSVSGVQPQGQPTQQQPQTYQTPSGIISDPVGLDLPQHPTLSGNVEAVSSPLRVDGNPFFAPTDVPGNYADLVKSGLTDANNQAKNVLTGQRQFETGRHNQAIEDHQRNQDNRLDRQLDAQIQGNYFKKYPPRGPALNNATLASQNLSPQEMKQYLLNGGSSGGGNQFGNAQKQVNLLQDSQNAISSEMVSSGLADENGNFVDNAGLFGLNNEQNELRRQQYQQLMSEYQSVNQQIRNTVGEVTQAQTNINAHGQASRQTFDELNKKLGIGN